MWKRLFAVPRRCSLKMYNILARSLDLGCSDVVYPILCHKLNQYVYSHCRSKGMCVWADPVSCFGSCLAVSEPMLLLPGKYVIQMCKFDFDSLNVHTSMTYFPGNSSMGSSQQGRNQNNSLDLPTHTYLGVLYRLVGSALIGCRVLYRLLGLGLTGFKVLYRLLGSGLSRV